MPQTPPLVRLNRIFGHSDDWESSWVECLCDAHRDYIVSRVQQEEQHEQAVIDDFLDEIEI